MTRTKLVEQLQAEMGLPRRHVESVVTGVLNDIKEALGKGETVKISGFGRLEIRTRAARRGRDPVSGEIRTLSPRPHLSFRPSKLLKEKVNP